MKKYVVWISLVLLVLTFAIVEGLVELPQAAVQFNGLMTIVSIMGLIVWTLKMQVADWRGE